MEVLIEEQEAAVKRLEEIAMIMKGLNQELEAIKSIPPNPISQARAIEIFEMSKELFEESDRIMAESNRRKEEVDKI